MTLALTALLSLTLAAVVAWVAESEAPDGAQDARNGHRRR